MSTLWQFPKGPARRALGWGGICVLVCLCSACSKSDRTPVYPARGQVLFEGEPIPHALVVLHPVNADNKEAPRPQGKVNADGAFTLSTYDAGDGAPAGEYAVTVQWLLSPASKGKSYEDSPPVNRLPARYARPQTSGLRIQIAQGSNDLPVLRLTKR
jgi:hypothetical protein